jgi:hypothetical protein
VFLGLVLRWFGRIVTVPFFGLELTRFERIVTVPFFGLELTWFERTVTATFPRRAEDRLCGLETYWRNQYAGASCAS